MAVRTEEITKEIAKYAWFSVNVRTGHEDKVCKNIIEASKNKGLDTEIVDCVVPKEKTDIVKRVLVEDDYGEPLRDEDGKYVYEDKTKKDQEVKKCPGYVFVKVGLHFKGMESNQEVYKMLDTVWYLIRNTNGVSRILGFGNTPKPMSDEEVYRLGLEERPEVKEPEEERVRIEVDYEVGDKVVIIMGAFVGKEAIVQSIDNYDDKVVVVTSILGKPTEVTLALKDVMVIPV